MKIRRIVIRTFIGVILVGFVIACANSSVSPIHSSSANTGAISNASTRIGTAKQQKLQARAAELGTKMAQNPCYVQIWEDENFQDDNDVILGPGKWNNMRNLPGANKSDWGDEIDSLKVGPKATVKVWEDENFNDNSRTFGPGIEMNNLRGSPDLGDTIDSMEITCQP